jgi:hypothetical protein
MIPKVIHYCWFSNEDKPLLVRRCIKSWRKIMPDYEIKCWDANSFDFDSVTYVKEAHEQQKWAFATDYIRFYAIYTEGGIYLDSDVEIKKSLTPFLNHKLFVGTEVLYNDPPVINPEPAIFGAEVGHQLLKKCMDYYKQKHFVLPNGQFDLTGCPEIMGKMMEQMYLYQYQDKYQHIGDEVHVYPSSVFCNILRMDKKHVYAIHRYANGWIQFTHRGWLFHLCKKYDLMEAYRLFEKIISGFK